jgi:hypothetical protein
MTKQVFKSYTKAMLVLFPAGPDKKLPVGYTIL